MIRNLKQSGDSRVHQSIPLCGARELFANVIGAQAVASSVQPQGRSPYQVSRWPSGKASASRAEDPGFESRLRRDFFGVESYQ